MFASAPTTWSLPREKSLTTEEVAEILSEAKKMNGRDYVFLVTSANTGLRLCEVVHIKKGDLQDGRLRVTRRKKKTLKPQLIDVGPEVWEVLSEWGQMFEEHEFIFSGKAASCYLRRSDGTSEQTCEGGHISRRNIQRRWELILSRCELKMPGRGIHSLRHFAVTQFYIAHKDLRAAQMFAAHSSSQITERYAHICDMREKVHAMKVAL